MARITVEDCIDKVENRFDLVLLAGHRTRQISTGSPITVDRDNDKNAIVALREIASETLCPGDLKEDLIHSFQKRVEIDEPESCIDARESSEVIHSDEHGNAIFNTSQPGKVFEELSEEELLRNIEDLVPPEKKNDE